MSDNTHPRTDPVNAPPHTAPGDIRLPDGTAVQTRNDFIRGRIVTATLTRGIWRHRIIFEDMDSQDTWTAAEIRAELFVHADARPAYEAIPQHPDDEWMDAAFESTHVAPGTYALHKDRDGNAAPLRVIIITPRGTVWGQNPAQGTCVTVPLDDIMPFRVASMGAAWPSDAPLAGPNFAIPRAFKPPRKGIAFEGDPPCHVCKRSVVPNEFGVQCLGGACDVFALEAAVHEEARYFHRECVAMPADTALGPFGITSLIMHPHAGFHSYRCSWCALAECSGTQLNSPTAVIPLHDCLARAAVDAANGGLSKDTTAQYASTWYRVLQFETATAWRILARSQRERTPNARAYMAMLAWYEATFTTTNGYAAKANTLAKVATVVNYVADRFDTRSPARTLAARDMLRGIQRRLGCSVNRAHPFRVCLLVRFLDHIQQRQPSLQNTVLMVGVTLAIFGFLRVGELLRLRRRHVRFVREDIRFLHVLLHLDWCKQDTFAVGCDILIAATTKTGLEIQKRTAALLDGLTAAGYIGKAAFLFPRGDDGAPHTPASFLGAVRTALTEMQALGEPLLDHVDIARDVTNKSFKRGGASSASDVNGDGAAIAVHGWVTRRMVENLKSRDIVTTYTDVEDAMKSMERRIRVTFLMGSG